MQPKAHYRSIVGKELEDTEKRQWNMNSILHVLGISLEGDDLCPFILDTLIHATHYLLVIKSSFAGPTGDVVSYL